jgi:Ca2+-binding EF-hand superfamily protein
MTHRDLIDWTEKLLKSYQFKPSEKEMRHLRSDLSHSRYAKSNEDTAVFTVVRIINQQTNLKMDEVRLLMNSFKSYSTPKTVDGLMDRKSFEVCVNKLLGVGTFLSDQLFRVLDTRCEGSIDFNDFVVCTEDNNNNQY